MKLLFNTETHFKTIRAHLKVSLSATYFNKNYTVHINTISITCTRTSDDREHVEGTLRSEGFSSFVFIIFDLGLSSALADTFIRNKEKHAECTIRSPPQTPSCYNNWSELKEEPVVLENGAT